MGTPAIAQLALHCWSTALLAHTHPRLSYHGCRQCAGQHSGGTALFYHNQMIPASRGAPCSARLLPSVAAPSDKQRYRICTCTGDRPGNCLDHPVQAVLFGDGAVPPEDLADIFNGADAAVPGRAGPFLLEVPDTAEQPFKRGAQNVFTVTVRTAPAMAADACGPHLSLRAGFTTQFRR